MTTDKEKTFYFLTPEEQRIKDKIEFFMQEKIVVHVQLKDKSFLNGYIEKKAREGIYWLIEKKLGKVFVFLRDVYEIEEFRDRDMNNSKLKEKVAGDVDCMLGEGVSKDEISMEGIDKSNVFKEYENKKQRNTYDINKKLKGSEKK